LFFYHSNIGKEIVGIVEVIKEAFLDKTDKDGRFVAVQVKFKEKLKKSVTLEEVKKPSLLAIYHLLDKADYLLCP
jgi:predicted RNA-binding protein with PUA-like domain